MSRFKKAYNDLKKDDARINFLDSTHSEFSAYSSNSTSLKPGKRKTITFLSYFFNYFFSCYLRFL